MADAEVGAELVAHNARRKARKAETEARRREAIEAGTDEGNGQASADETRIQRRKNAGLVHRLNRRLFGGNRVATCGRAREVTVGIKRARVNGRRCHWTGLEACGSIHACLTCGGKTRSHRATEIETVIKGALADGLYAVMVTLTVPHWGADDLAELYGYNAPGRDPKRGIRAAWNLMSKSSAFRRFKAAYGVSGSSGRWSSPTASTATTPICIWC